MNFSAAGQIAATNRTCLIEILKGVVSVIGANALEALAAASHALAVVAVIAGRAAAMQSLAAETMVG